jgi:hypothetical protein
MTAGSAAHPGPDFIESDLEFQAEPGLPAPPQEDARRFEREAYQNAVEAAIFPPHASTTNMPDRCRVLTSDVSRGGVCILHTRPLYPEQRVDLTLNGAERALRVCWCTKIGDRCYVAGCKFGWP